MWKPIILDVECIVCNKSLQKINHDPREVKRKMGKIINRRSRTPNWSADEKKYLLELIRDRKAVVVTKNNNGPNYSEEKDVAWNEILCGLSAKFGNKFNSSCIKKVKTQWQNMKRIAREEIALNGHQLDKYTEQSLEVCGLLDLVRDGVLRKEENSNEIIMTTNVVVKTECIDEDISQPSCSGINSSSMIQEAEQNELTINQLDTSESSVSEQISEVNDSLTTERQYELKNACVMTDEVLNPFHKEYLNYFKYTETEKQLKIESLKEERQIVRAMRETAELNKIIAEQRLKHVLWIKKCEMTMYGTGEPGSGAGQGGGTGGSIRDAGGSFGKMQVAREEEYFYKKQKEQLKGLKTHLDKEIAFHQEQIKRHEDAIRRHREQMTDIEKP